ncbi:hypothetical protein K431DRAFT_315613 [Polychaeton citri CBS 116435]|uniref:Zn(2)-C6 fungal-type domain-containing protein n=1 Tax=Polychaeton citri CBS 116435 TaxID=1314669 RepID=A0A9P4UM43_9PEZI|nr:hypothetical protein K431DRAFT_315613 [Polychaeton citri CBS 116435]
MAPRSRTGCLTCRQRKLKCSEERPVCAQCIKAHRECIPSSGITFRHQQNPSMNGTKASRESLKNFYGYKETFGRGTVWVPIPGELNFVHTNNPYEDEDSHIESFVEIPATEPPVSVSDHGPEYVPAANMGMGSLSSSIEARTQTQTNQAGSMAPSPYGNYSTYATHGLEALSAVASQDQYNYAPPPAPMGQTTDMQTSPTQQHFSANSPASPQSQHSHTGSQSNQGIDFLLNQSANAEAANTSSPTQQQNTSNIDPRLNSPFQSASQPAVVYLPPSDTQPQRARTPSDPKNSLHADFAVQSSPTQEQQLQALLQSSTAEG